MSPSRPTLLQTLARLSFVFGLTWVVARTFLYFLPGDPAVFLSHEALVDIQPEVLRDRMQLAQSWQERVLSLPRSASLITGKPVWPTLWEAFCRSLTLTSLTLALLTLMTTLILIVAHRSRRARRAAETVSIAIAALPLFVLGPILLYALALRLGWFPVSHSPLLPALTFSIYLTGFWFRTLQKKIDRYQPMSALLGAESRGVPPSRAFVRYLLLPCLGSYFGFLGAQIGTLLNGSVLIEVIFQWNGLGSLLADSVLSRDYPLVEGTILLITFITLFCLQIGYFAQQAWEEKLS